MTPTNMKGPDHGDFRITNEMIDCMHRHNRNTAKRCYNHDMEAQRMQKIMEQDEVHRNYIQNMSEQDRNYIQYMEDKYGA